MLETTNACYVFYLTKVHEKETLRKRNWERLTAGTLVATELRGTTRISGIAASYFVNKYPMAKIPPANPMQMGSVSIHAIAIFFTVAD